MNNKMKLNQTQVGLLIMIHNIIKVHESLSIPSLGAGNTFNILLNDRLNSSQHKQQITLPIVAAKNIWMQCVHWHSGASERCLTMCRWHVTKHVTEQRHALQWMERAVTIIDRVAALLLFSEPQAFTRQACFSALSNKTKCCIACLTSEVHPTGISC